MASSVTAIGNTHAKMDANERTPWMVFALWAVVALGLGITWVRVIAPGYNLERRGIDLIHHALMIQDQAKPAGEPALQVSGFARYPQLSHWLASWLMPLVRDDAIRAMRALGFTAILLLFGLQYMLLREQTSVHVALAAVVLWQWLCLEGCFANVNFFHGTCFFAQAVGMVGFWLALVLAARPFPWADRVDETWLPLLSMLGPVLAGWFAYQCHFVPGVVTFGAIWLFAACAWLRQPSWAAAWALGFTTLVPAVIVLSSDQFRYMAASSTADGPIPIRHPWLVLAAIPTAAVGLARLYQDWRSPRLSEVERLLIHALLVAGACQSYLAYKWLIQETVAGYCVKKLFFHTFPVAALLWVWWLLQWSKRWRPWFSNSSFSWSFGSWQARAAWVLVVAAGVYANAVRPLRKDLRGPFALGERDPVQAARLLATQRHELHSGCYFDPQFPGGAVFANVAARLLPLDISEKICLPTHPVGGADSPGSAPEVNKLVLPRDVQPPASFPNPRRVGPFAIADFPSSY